MVVVRTTRDVEQGTGEQVLAFRIGRGRKGRKGAGARGVLKKKVTGEGDGGEENRKLAGEGDSWSWFFLERIAGGELE